MCDEYFFLRRKASDSSKSTKEKVDALLERIRSAAEIPRRPQAPASQPQPQTEREKQPA